LIYVDVLGLLVCVRGKSVLELGLLVVGRMVDDVRDGDEEERRYETFVGGEI